MVFFDRIDRQELKFRLNKKIGSSSLLNLVNQAIDLEINPTVDCPRSKLENMGIFQGCGIRQGMPLSPILSNFALSRFDRVVEAAGISMVRYADDIVVFAATKDMCLKAADVVVGELQALGHSVPPMGDGSKTNIVTKFEPLSFLGRDIEFSERYGMFVQKISKKKMKTVLSFLTEMGDLDKLISKNISFAEFNVKISQTVSSYVNAYRDASNISHFEYEMRRVAKESIKNIYAKIFGPSSFLKLSENHARFLGVDALDISDVDIVDLF